MCKRVLTVSGLFLVLGVASCCLLVTLFVLPRRVSEGNFARIQNGMTEDQVRAIIGEPVDSFQAPGVEVNGVNVDVMKEWSGSRGIIVIGFDANGRVIDKGMVTIPNPNEGLIEMIYTQLGW